MSWKDIEKNVLASLGESQRKWVEKNVNLDENNDLLLKPRKELLKMFPDVVQHKKKNRIKYAALDDTACVRTFIWQAWLRIKAREIEPVEGNIRSFWYRDLEPFYMDKTKID